MQGKVSMVMPCYNKVKYISEMFDSILAQNWDKIELILVNDGSTDGTRAIIAEYESRFCKRGFEVVIVDQENAGVCAAAKAGLKLITGDYVCMVDSDDELDPNYVSTMAGWLDEHPEHDFTACEGVTYTNSGTNKVFENFCFRQINDDKPYLAERYILALIRQTVWIYMVRAEYLHKCRIVETYHTATKGSHEPGYIIPLLSFGGRLKFFPLPLYHFNKTDDGHSQFKRFEQAQSFYDEYDRLCKTAINSLPNEIVDNTMKKKLTATSIISKNILLFEAANNMPDGSEQVSRIFDKLLDSVNSLFSVTPPITREQTCGLERIFILAIKNSLLDHEATAIPNGRIVGYGALGKAAANLLPRLKGTKFEPSDLWDIAGDGVTVKTPDFSSLNEKDTLLAFPTGKIEEKLQEGFTKSPFRIIYNTEILNLIAHEIFGKFFCKI